MIQHTPLDASRLSPAAQRALGPGPGRTMAARGLLPLPPADQVAVLYQLVARRRVEPGAVGARDRGRAPREAARRHARRSRPPIRGSCDFFAAADRRQAGGVRRDRAQPRGRRSRRSRRSPAAPASREVDQIAQNEQRLLRHPEIIAAMYMNRTRPDVDDRSRGRARGAQQRPGPGARGVGRGRARARPASPPASPEADAMFAAIAASSARDDSALTAGDADQPLPEDDAGPAPAPAAVDDEDRAQADRCRCKIRLATLGDAFERARRIRDPVQHGRDGGDQGAGSDRHRGRALRR